MVTTSLDRQALMLQEYAALRQEILKRIESRYQFLALVIPLAAGVFGFAVKDNSPQLLFLYPLVPGALVAGWVWHNCAILDIAEYLWHEYEGSPRHALWETYLACRQPTGLCTSQLETVTGWAVFLGSQLFALFMGTYINWNPSLTCEPTPFCKMAPDPWPLWAILDSMAILATVCALVYGQNYTQSVRRAVSQAVGHLNLDPAAEPGSVRDDTDFRAAARSLRR